MRRPLRSVAEREVGQIRAVPTETHLLQRMKASWPKANVKAATTHPAFSRNPSTRRTAVHEPGNRLVTDYPAYSRPAQVVGSLLQTAAVGCHDQSHRQHPCPSDNDRIHASAERTNRGKRLGA